MPLNEKKQLLERKKANSRNSKKQKSKQSEYKINKRAKSRRINVNN